MKYFDNELELLSQGSVLRLKGTDTIFSLAHEKLPTDTRKDVTYGQIVCNYRPKKDKSHQKIIVGGGNLICFPGHFITRTEEITTSKIILNHTTSTKGAQFLCWDIKKFYLGTQMDRYE